MAICFRYEGKACDPGFTPAVINVSYGGCTFVFDYCYKCSPGSLIDFHATNFICRPNSPACQAIYIANITAIRDLAAQVVNQYATSICTYFDCANGNGHQTLFQDFPRCMKYQTICYGNNNIIAYQEYGCEDAICRRSSWICLDWTCLPTPPCIRESNVRYTPLFPPSQFCPNSPIVYSSTCGGYSSCYLVPSWCDL